MKKNTKTNLLKMAAILIVITIISNVFIGYRLTPESAVKAVRFYPAEAPVILLNERINSNCVFYLVDAGEQYFTVKKQNFYGEGMLARVDKKKQKAA